jgi:hypothetical protein
MWCAKQSTQNWVLAKSCAMSLLQSFISFREYHESKTPVKRNKLQNQSNNMVKSAGGQLKQSIDHGEKNVGGHDVK